MPSSRQNTRCRRRSLANASRKLVIVTTWCTLGLTMKTDRANTVITVPHVRESSHSTKNRDWGVFVVPALLSLAFLWSGGFSRLAQAVLSLAVCAVLLHVMRRASRPTLALRPLACMTALLPVALMVTQDRSASSVRYGVLLTIGAAYALGWLLLDTPEKLGFVIRGLSTVACVIASVGLAASAVSLVVPNTQVAVLARSAGLVDTHGRAASTMGYPNALAALCLFAIPVGIAQLGTRTSKRSRGAWLCLVCLLSATLLATGSRGALLVGIVAATGLLASRWKTLGRSRRTCLIVTGVVLATTIVFASMRRLQPGAAAVTSLLAALKASIADRTTMATDAISSLAAAPFFGRGLGTYPLVYKTFRTRLIYSTDPHSLLLLLLVECGLVGTALCALMLTAGLRAWLSLLRHMYAESPDKPTVSAALIGLCLLTLHSLIDWDALFLALPLTLAVLAGGALGLRQSLDALPSSSRAPSLPRRRAAWLSRGTLSLAGVGIALCVAVAASTLLSSAASPLSSGQPRTAEAMYTTASMINPFDATPWWARARMAHNDAGNSPPAALWKQALDRSPADSTLVADATASLLALQDKQAVDLYQTYVSMDPLYSGGYAALALARYQILNDAPQALAALEKALQLDPFCAPALNLKARILTDLGKLDSARDLYLQVLEHDPANAVASVALAQDAIRAHDYPAAIERLWAAANPTVHPPQVDALLGTLVPPVTDFITLDPSAAPTISWSCSRDARIEGWSIVYYDAPCHWTRIALLPADARTYHLTGAAPAPSQLIIYACAPVFMGTRNGGWITRAVIPLSSPRLPSGR